jgi:predicted dehydrogenase
VSGEGGLRVGIIGCGLIGAKRAEALRPQDQLIATMDVVADRAFTLAERHGARHCANVDELLSLQPDAVIVAVTHDQLAGLATDALRAAAHVLVEKPGGVSSAQIVALGRVATDIGKVVKVGFNHRFHPALVDLAAEVHSGVHGDLMYILGRYGHGGRLGYDREWRADPARSGGGELIDQGMHLLDLSNWLAGPLPLHSALLKTHFWDTAVEDNAALILGDAGDRSSPWAMLHVTWTEWKNLFSLEVYCRAAKLEVDGLVRSYGTQRLRIYRMRPELGPPELEERQYPSEDQSWRLEWEHFTDAIGGGVPLVGGLDDARYAWQRVEDAYATAPQYEAIRGVSTL